MSRFAIFVDNKIYLLRLLLVYADYLWRKILILSCFHGAMIISGL